MSNYILLDVNGTVGTDTVPILEKIENPDNFIWVDKVEAHIKLSTLTTIKRLCEEYDATVLWCSLRADDPLCLNNLIDVNWGWLDVNSKVVRSNEWSNALLPSSIAGFLPGFWEIAFIFVWIVCHLWHIAFEFTNFKLIDKLSNEREGM